MDEPRSQMQRLRSIAEIYPISWTRPQKITIPRELGTSEIVEYELGICQRSYPGDFYRTNAITDHYSEHVRIKCNEFGKPSPLESWISLNLQEIVNEKKGGARGCNLMNTAYLTYLYKRFAGWGDRALASIAAGCSEYIAFDPNPDLIEPYRRIAKDFP